MNQRSEIFRIVDANFNRSREGLRVCEEIARLVLEDRSLTRALKKARHTVSDCLGKFPFRLAELLRARDTAADVGRPSASLESERRDWSGVFLANIERTKESLRVLEETAKLLGTPLAVRFKKIRFCAYEIEKKALPGLEALRDHGLRGLKRPVSGGGGARRHPRRRRRDSASR